MTSLKKSRSVFSRLGKQFLALEKSIGAKFSKALALVDECDGAVLVVSCGKSTHAAAKLVSTLRTAGKKAYCMTPAEALRGEAASVSGKDVAIIISSGGDSDEIMKIIPWLKKKETKIICITPSQRSNVARDSDIVLNAAPPADATDGLIAYSSGITALAIGELIGMTLLYNQDIEHPRSSSLSADSGEAIYTIEDLVSAHPDNPVVNWDTPFRDALIELTSKGLGAISVVGDDGTLAGIITDGDVRRLLQKSVGSLARIFLTNVDTVMTVNPKRISIDKTLTDALTVMEENAITVLPVVDMKDRPMGMIHLHDLVQMGLSHAPEEKPAAGQKKKPASKTKKKAAAKKKTKKKVKK